MMMMFTTVLKKRFVLAIEEGNYELAKVLLLNLGDYYTTNGFDTALEAIEFESVVKWFDTNVVNTVMA